MAEIQIPNGIIKFEIIKIEMLIMSSVFTKIINNEILHTRFSKMISSRFFYIFPLTYGHVLVVPKKRNKLYF